MATAARRSEHHLIITRPGSAMDAPEVLRLRGPDGWDLPRIYLKAQEGAPTGRRRGGAADTALAETRARCRARLRRPGIEWCSPRAFS